jgi:large subunit ribosomal protein L21
MFAVIKTGGKQYRVQAGDLLVVEKLDGDVGAVVSFDQVLMLGEGADVLIGAPAVDGAVVTATLIETRKGEKVKIFKKIRRQGYRRTRGHRQFESVLRVTSVDGGGKSAKWDGEVNLTPLSVLNARARGLAVRADAAEAPKAKAAPKPTPAPKVAKPAVEAAPAAEAAAPKKAAAAKPAKAAATPKAPTKAAAAPKAAKPAPAKKPTSAKAAPKGR